MGDVFVLFKRKKERELEREIEGREDDIEIIRQIQIW